MIMIYVITVLLLSTPQLCWSWGSYFSPIKFKSSSSIHQGRRSSHHTSLKMELFEGNPIGKFIWDQVWKLPIMKLGTPGTSPTTFGDNANVLKGNILQLYGGLPSVDGAPIAEGKAAGVFEGMLYIGLQKYYETFGGVYKLVLGPKSFIIVSDPLVMKHILRDNAKAYDKGVLSEILEPIMGNGLIPATPEVAIVRRRAILPGFHKNWYNVMSRMFGECNRPLITKLHQYSTSGETLNMETEFCSVALDIIGRAVFNYDFGSVTTESPVIKAVYSTLKEAEHRSIIPFPYWDLPLANLLVPRLREFNSNLKLLDNILNELIVKALATQNVADVEDLEKRDYASMENPSLLRFLVDMRGENTTSKQLRDDLMTMLIAGHETTAAVLTWALFELSQQPELVQTLREEIDRVVGPDREPTFDDITKLQLIRLTVAESLRMYPEPTLLIRRALEDDLLPQAMGTDFRCKIVRGSDLFLAIYNLHRSPDYWENPNKFDPTRFLRPFSNPNRPEWAGYTPNLTTMYPNEIHADFAYLPFGAGTRKCIGDQFACMEAVVTLVMILRDFDFQLAIKPEDVGVFTAATIHTRNGLMMKVSRRSRDLNNSAGSGSASSRSKTSDVGVNTDQSASV